MLRPNVSCIGPRTCPALGPVDMTAPNRRMSYLVLAELSGGPCRLPNLVLCPACRASCRLWYLWGRR